jgi:hypothetical protein
MLQLQIQYVYCHASMISVASLPKETVNLIYEYNYNPVKGQKSSMINQIWRTLQNSKW